MQTRQAEAGAAVLVAQTYRTHRAALVPYGESRRVREWTAAAVDLARQAGDAARERSAASGTPDRGPILVAGALGLPRRGAGFGEGRLPVDIPVAAVREQAGVLAEAGVDALVVEGVEVAADADLVGEAAAESGVPILAEITREAPEPRRALEALAALPIAGVLLGLGFPASADPAGELADIAAWAAGGAPAVGAWLWAHPGDDAEPTGLAAVAAGWVEAGARLLGVAEAATPDAIEALASAVAERDAADEAARRAGDAAWRAALDEAVARAPRGHALWIGTRPAAEPPGGFAWSYAGAEELRRLPSGHFRLVVAPDVVADVRALAEAAEEGGMLLVRTAPDAPRPADVRIVGVTATGGEVVLLARRELR
jgi:homocysteine S-methyltransferase